MYFFTDYTYKIINRYRNFVPHEDTIAIGRQARPKLYDWMQPPPECLDGDVMSAPQLYCH